ncbi:ribosomal protein S6 kinase delta-1-like protein, partial [Leptotrombidium deliense]
MTRHGDNQWINIFEIRETAKDPIKGHTIYKVVSKLFPKNSIESVSEIVVWKRFNDFKQLHKALSRLHQSLHLKGVFPKLPESKIFGRFTESVIEERKNAALQLLEFAAKYAPLLTSNVFVKFFENAKVSVDSETEKLPKPIEPRKLSETESSFSFKSDCSEESGSDLSPKLVSSGCYSTLKNDTREKLEDFDPFIRSTETESSWESVDNSWLLVVETTSDPKESDCDKVEDDVLHFPKPFSDFPDVTNHDKQIETSDDKHFKVENDNSQVTPQVNNEAGIFKPSQVTNNSTYLIDAATLISQAQQHENDQEFEASFESYKCAVGILLQGAKNETDSEIKDMVRRKTIKYLARAEEISAKYLDKSGNVGKWAPDSPYKLFSQSITPLRGESIHSLRHLKVVDVIASVQLKPINSKQSPIFPTDVPHMVKLHKVYETDYSYFVLLQYIFGGKLCDYVYRDLGYHKLSPCVDCTFLSLQNEEESGVCLNPSRNLFSVSESDDDIDENSVEKLDSYCGSISSIDSIGMDDAACCQSYVEMCS